MPIHRYSVVAFGLFSLRRRDTARPFDHLETFRKCVAMDKKPYHFLVVEDNEDHAQVVLHSLERSNPPGGVSAHCRR